MVCVEPTSDHKPGVKIPEQPPEPHAFRERVIELTAAVVYLGVPIALLIYFL